MMSALEKAKALQEFRQLRAKFGILVMSPLEKVKALKRFRELRGLLGGGEQPAASQQNIDEKEPTLPQQQAKLLANFPVLQSFIDAAKSKGIGYNGISWDGAYCKLPIGDGGLGNSVDVAFNVSGKEKGQLTVKRWKVEAGEYEIIATFAADESNIPAALSAAEKYVSEKEVVPFDTSEFAGPGDISGSVFYVKNPHNGADVPVASIEEAAAKYKEFMDRTNADRPAGMDVYSSETFQPVANIKADGSWTQVETREEARARSDREIDLLNNEKGLRVTFMGESFQVDSLEDASKKWREFVEREGLGASEIMNAMGSDSVPVMQDGVQVARISYNGRVWDMEGNEIDVGTGFTKLDVLNHPAYGLLKGIISGSIDTFKDKAKLQELSDSLAKAGGDDMPAGEVRDLFEKAIRAAGVQVLTGFGYLEAAA